MGKIVANSEKLSDYENMVNRVNSAIYRYFDSPIMDHYEIAFPITSTILALVADVVPENIASLIHEGIHDYIRTAHASIRDEETGDYDDWDYRDYFREHAQHIYEDD